MRSIDYKVKEIKTMFCGTRTSFTKPRQWLDNIHIEFFQKPQPHWVEVTFNNQPHCAICCSITIGSHARKVSTVWFNNIRYSQIPGSPHIISNKGQTQQKLIQNSPPARGSLHPSLPLGGRGTVRVKCLACEQQARYRARKPEHVPPYRPLNIGSLSSISPLPLPNPF